VTRPSAAMRRDVVRRAGNRCEYCLIHQDDAASRLQVDHAIAEKHGGATTLDNLALSCLPCNRRKASDIAANDPETSALTRLFNPRLQSWVDHFRITGPRIVGLTEGRTTVAFLQLNSPERVLEREELISAGRFPADRPIASWPSQNRRRADHISPLARPLLRPDFPFADVGPSTVGLTSEGSLPGG